ncbi:MAG: helix-turn-helix domain-containing protein [Patescibacteria group bacterium]
MKLEIPSKIKEFLKKSGFNDKEERVYLFLLSSGPQTVSRIAQTCGLVRTNAYDVVKSLEKRGLCFSQGTEYGRKIKANKAEEILEILNDRAKEISVLKNELHELLPAFESLSSFPSSSHSQLSYFQGQESLKKLIRLSLQSVDKELRFAGSELDMLEKLGQEFLMDYQQRRVAKGIFIRSLRPGLKRGGHERGEDSKYFRELRLRPEGLIRLKSNIILWDDKVAFYSLEDGLFGSLIESGPLVVMLKSWFDFIWNKSKIIK